MTKYGTIRSVWVNWANSDQCPLCGREGKDIANVWRKGHARQNGVILEDGLSYCQECASTPECEKHWKKWWAEQWRKEEERCEENWKKYGVYTNVSGLGGTPSFYFGYVKTLFGFKPYLSVYPDCPRYKLERGVSRLKYQWRKIGIEECRRLITLLVKESTAEQTFKDIVLADTNEYLDEVKNESTGSNEGQSEKGDV